ncbi:molybdopterin-dependent oxidoreductase [Pyruvatibacter mobilis]|uniref:nitrate reductase n=1 Tax=Pyruvatibacter mobilis TaxID=1712261 RepID=UPI003D0DE373
MTDAPDIRTICPYCGVGCGVIASRTTDGRLEVKGDPDHPANFGRLCSKGSALAETLDADGRLLQPRLHGRDTDWDEALDAVASGLGEVIDAHGPDAVALYGSGQLLTEDYYVANKLMKGFIGTANMDTNSRLCMASSVAGHKRAFGSDTVPGTYEDLEQADLVVLVGSNFAWCHPVLFQRLQAAQAKRGTRIIVIDPRRTATAEAADLHLPLRPGSDVALFNGLLAHLATVGAQDTAFIADHVTGLDDALAAAQGLSVYEVAAATGLDAITLTRFFDMVAATQRVVTVYSQGVNQSTAGTDKVNAIINCHLFTGRIGKPGTGPFSITGQPNAMGGREVGGLANQLAAHMAIDSADDRDRVQRFWQAPSMVSTPGLMAVDLFRAIDRGEVKAVWIMATNPAASLPEADAVARALERCPLVIVSDVTDQTRTAKLADILLPAAGWGEKDGTVTNSERRISRQRPLLPPAGEARADWRIICDVARRMGFAGFDFASPAAIFREHAQLSAFENGGTRDFDIGAYGAVEDAAYDAMRPFQWPAPKDQPPGGRFFAYGGFFTGDGRARMVATPVRSLAEAPSDAWPLRLNTGRIRDQWHTMTRTGQVPRLFSHLAEPFAELHPEDAEAAGIKDADLVTVKSPHGQVIVRALITDRQQKGSVFVPMHWTDPYASCAHADALVAGHVDPVSGQPELKHMPVAVDKFDADWQAFVVSASRPDPAGAAYWSLARAEGGWRAEMAGIDHAGMNADRACALMGLAPLPDDDRLEAGDLARGDYRLALVRGGRLAGLVVAGRGPVAAARSWLADQLDTDMTGTRRHRILAGRMGADEPDRGAIICACFQVGINQIADAARAGAQSVDAIGACLHAGTNCGSCRAEIKRIVEVAHVRQAG